MDRQLGEVYVRDGKEYIVYNVSQYKQFKVICSAPLMDEAKAKLQHIEIRKDIEAFMYAYNHKEEMLKNLSKRNR